MDDKPTLSSAKFQRLPAFLQAKIAKAIGHGAVTKEISLPTDMCECCWCCSRIDLDLVNAITIPIEEPDDVWEQIRQVETRVINQLALVCPCAIVTDPYGAYRQGLENIGAKLLATDLYELDFRALGGRSSLEQALEFVSTEWSVNLVLTAEPPDPDDLSSLWSKPMCGIAEIFDDGHWVFLCREADQDALGFGKFV